MKFLALILLASSFANASLVAVIDSGLDVNHKQLVGHIWKNASEEANYRDDDGDGYQDDFYGWNFAEQNNLVIDYKYLGTFSTNCYKLFDVQARLLLGTATDEDKAWMKTMREDKAFIAELGKFGNFVHGTHVAGIAVRGTNSQAMGIKLIPTETKLFFDRFMSIKRAKIAGDDGKWQLLNMALSALAGQQMKLLTEIGVYVNFHNADVANGSFGTGFKQAKMITDAAYQLIFFKKPSDEDSDKAAKLFMDALIKQGEGFVKVAPHTLFVFAAGNDGSNNDLYPSSPTNIKAQNVISVAATYNREFLASFSNFGTATVDIAAPGMIIESTIPGDEMLKVSGTSQASPYVAHVALLVKEQNAKLSPMEVKKILMGTVDKKLFLADKVKSGGVVNPDRAKVAASLTVSMTIDEAISQASLQVEDVETHHSMVENNVVPMAMPSMFR